MAGLVVRSPQKSREGADEFPMPHGHLSTQAIEIDGAVDLRLSHQFDAPSSVQPEVPEVMADVFGETCRSP